MKVASHLLKLYSDLGAKAQILDLCSLSLSDAVGGDYLKGPKGSFQQAVERVSAAEGLVVVVPEYNGSYPGILKLFIDYWKYPESFEHRPIAMVGLGYRWGGLRPVEHLQQVFGYRNSYVFPNRVFLQNIGNVLKNDQIVDPVLGELLAVQSREFLKFIHGLQLKELDANTKLLSTKKK